MENKLPLTRILAFIAISTALLLIAVQTISASPNTRARIDQSKQKLINAEKELCGFKVFELQQKIGDGEHTNEDLVLLSRLSTDGELNTEGCHDLAVKVLSEGLQ